MGNRIPVKYDANLTNSKKEYENILIKRIRLWDWLLIYLVGV